MSDKPPIKFSCRDECGNFTFVPADNPNPPPGWQYLEIGRGWRCPECHRALEKINDQVHGVR